MDLSVSLLPSGGYGYSFPSVRIKPLNFMEVCTYVNDITETEGDPLGKYLYDIRQLQKDDPNIKDMYVMDVDFLIFYKKLITVSDDLSYRVEVKCPNCDRKIKKTINFPDDIKVKPADEKIMNGSVITLGGNSYETIVPTIDQFMKVFNVYMRYKKVTDIKMIKTISLIKDFETQSNQVENDVLGAKHSDITLLMALRELYFDRIEPVQVKCLNCHKEGEKGGVMAVSVDSLIVDFFRELFINSPIDGSKVLFK